MSNTNQFDQIFNSLKHDKDKLEMKHLKNMIFDGTNGPLWTRAFEPYHFFRNKRLMREIKNRYGRELVDECLKDEDKKESILRPLIETFMCDNLKKTLEILNITRMIKGHDPQWSYKIAIHCDGKMLIIDVGISKVYQGGHIGAIEIDLITDKIKIIGESQVYTKDNSKKRE